MVQRYFTSIGIGPGCDVQPPKKVAFRGRPTWREKVAAQRHKGM
jgi:hypothetical protein